MVRTRERKQQSTVNARPVLQFRVHQDVYEELKKSAKDRKLSISEEAARCIGVAISLDQQKLDLQTIETMETEQMFRAKGYTKVRDADGHELWAKGAPAVAKWTTLSPELEAIIDRAVERALEKGKR